MSKFVLSHVWAGWYAKKTQGLYWFGQNVPTSSSWLLLVLFKKFVIGVTNRREKDMFQVSSEKNKRVPIAQLLLLCVSGSDRFGVGSDPLHGTPYFPFYRSRVSTGYSGGKEKNEREKRKAFRTAGSFFSFTRVLPTL